MDVINSINAALKGKNPMGMPILPPSNSAGPNSSTNNIKQEPGETKEQRRARKRKSRWGGDDGVEKTFIPGMPTMMPQGLSKEQEEAYLRKCFDNKAS